MGIPRIKHRTLRLGSSQPPSLRHEGLLRHHATDKTGDLLATIGAKPRDTNRWIRCHVLSDTGSVSDLVVEFVLVDTIRGRGLADLAGSAGEHQRVVDAVFLWIEKVGAGSPMLAAFCRPEERIERDITYHSRQNRKWTWSTSFSCLETPPAGEGLADILIIEAEVGLAKVVSSKDALERSGQTGDQA